MDYIKRLLIESFKIVFCFLAFSLFIVLMFREGFFLQTLGRNHLNYNFKLNDQTYETKKGGINNLNFNV